MQHYYLCQLDELPPDPGWLGTQPWPVIAHGVGSTSCNADAIVPDRAAADLLIQRIEANPIASLVLVQTTRCGEHLDAEQALDLESLAYATLQGGQEFTHWRSLAQPGSAPAEDQSGAPVLLSRDDGLVRAQLNRPGNRNAMNRAMRDAWVEALELLALDDSISRMHFTGNGACFSTGGDLSEFGSFPDPAKAHQLRGICSPARLLSRHAARASFYLHGACLGSGIELPAFAQRVAAHSRSFFQLPELQLGLIPGAGGTVSIARRIGRQRMVWMVLSGKRINAGQALEWGLIDEIADQDPYLPANG